MTPPSTLDLAKAALMLFATTDALKDAPQKQQKTLDLPSALRLHFVAIRQSVFTLATEPMN